MKKALLAALLLASNWIFAQGTFELTTKLHKMSDEEFKTLKSRAEAGDPNSQFVMGVAYTIGFRRVGVKVDKKEASSWLSKPALKDDPEAAFWLLYPSLQTIEQKKLRPMLKDLAERGSLGAMNLYADFAVEGAGGPRD
jgi:TPR repeat protein